MSVNAAKLRTRWDEENDDSESGVLFLNSFLTLTQHFLDYHPILTCSDTLLTLPSTRLVPSSMRNMPA